MATRIKKGIYCLEGIWEHRNPRDKSTVRPILNLMEKIGSCNHIYHDCATKAELEFYLSRWKTKAVNKKYPILYLAFHGFDGHICLNDNYDYSLDELADYLGDRCAGKIVYFGSCSTLNIDKRLINKFLAKTGLIAVMGYKGEIGWIQSTACDLFIFVALQSDKLDAKGIENIYNILTTDYGNLPKILNLRVVINENIK